MSFLAKGLANWRRNFVLVPSLFALKFLLALLITGPVLGLIGEPLTRSVYASPLMSQWDLGIITELVRANDGLASAFLLMLVSFTVIAFLLGQFLHGGVFTQLLRRKQFSVRTFFGNSADQFRSHLLISFFMLPVYLLLFFAGVSLASLIPSDLFGHFGEAGFASTILQGGVVGLFLLVGIVLSTTLRLHRAAVPGGTFKERFETSLNFLRRHGVQVYAAYLVWFAPFLILWVLVEWLSLRVVALASGFSVLLVEMMLFQFCSVARTGQSLLFSATVAPLMAAFVAGNAASPTPQQVDND